MALRIERFFPQIPRKLRMARMTDTPAYYAQKAIMISVGGCFGLTMVMFGMLQGSLSSLYTMLLTPVIFVYVMGMADAKILRLQRDTDQEIVYAGRFLVIELDSGVPLYNTFVNLGRNYKHVGKYFQEVVDMVNLGTAMEDAINEQLDYLPSDALRKIFWQILNSLRTGSELSNSIQIAIDHIVRQQKILVVEYGRKLNPLAMFFMMMAVILPSLGITMIIVMATFIGFELSLPILITGAGFLAFVQFMFLNVIRSSRPAVSF